MSSHMIKPPQLVSAFDVHVENPYKPWKSPLHMHNNTEIFFIQEGEGEFVVDNVKLRPKKGDIVVHHPLVEHQEASANGSSFRAVSIQINGLELRDKPKGKLLDDGSPPVVSLQDCFGTVNQCFQEILAEHRDMKPFHQEMVSSLTQMIIMLLLRNQQAAQEQSYSLATREIVAYIDEHYRQELSLNELADIVHISPYHLAHVFKKEAGLSPIQYLIRCRIEEAKKQLLESDRSVAEIAEDVGYPNANYFNILFKKVTGENPGKFRSKRR